MKTKNNKNKKQNLMEHLQAYRLVRAAAILDKASQLQLHVKFTCTYAKK